MSIITKTNQPRAANIPSQKNTLPWKLTEPKYRFCDLILDHSTISQLNDVVSFYQHQDLLLNTWGLAERYAEKGGLAANLYGEPGTGKTMAAHAIAKALGKKLILVDYAEIESKYVGETAKNLTALFQTAEAHDAIIFFDEADALLSKRVTAMASATDVSVNQTRSVLLNLLNDYKGITLFATNFLQNYDSAFLRRIRYHIHFPLPDADHREMLWKQYIPARMPCHADCRELAEQYDGVSGSDIANAVFTAAVSAARNHAKEVSQVSLERAIQNTIDVKSANNRNGLRKYTEGIEVMDDQRDETKKVREL